MMSNILLLCLDWFIYIVACVLIYKWLKERYVEPTYGNLIYMVYSEANSKAYHYYLCYEDMEGNRSCKRINNGLDGYYEINKINRSPEYLNYVKPWLQGANSIPDKYLSKEVEKIIGCIHCDREIKIDSRLYNDEYITCNNCYKVNENPYKKSHKEHLKDIIDNEVLPKLKKVLSDTNYKKVVKILSGDKL